MMTEWGIPASVDLLNAHPMKGFLRTPDGELRPLHEDIKCGAQESRVKNQDS